MRQPTRNALRQALATLKRLEASAPFVMPSGTPRALFLTEALALQDVRDLLAVLTGEHPDIVTGTEATNESEVTTTEVTCVQKT